MRQTDEALDHIRRLGGDIAAAGGDEGVVDALLAYLVEESGGQTMLDGCAEALREGWGRVAASIGRLKPATRITLRNDFHGTEVAADAQRIGRRYWLSRRQVSRINRALCGMRDCACSAYPGVRDERVAEMGREADERYVILSDTA